MAPGRWYRISGDAPDLGLPPTPPGTRYLEDNDPARDPKLNPAADARERVRRLVGRRPKAPWSGKMGFPAITEAWNGAVLATKSGACGSMILFGGGHNDYFGSDVHRFDLATRQWSRISDGFLGGIPDAYGAGAVYPTTTYPDGSPLPPHTYGYVQYDAVGNDLLLFKGQIELGAEVRAAPVAHLFNLESLRWRRGSEHEHAVFNSGGWTTWDARRRVLWGHSGDDGGGNGLSWFAPDGLNDDGTCGRWGPLFSSKLPGQANHNVMQIDPHRDVILIPAHEPNALLALNPQAPAAPLQRLAEEGERPPLAPYAGLEFSLRLDCFVYCASASRLTLRAIKPDAQRSSWRWERLGVADDPLDPIDDAAARTAYACHRAHIFGRFRVVDYAGATLAILVRHVDTPVYAMKI